MANVDNLINQDFLGQGKSAKVTLVYDQNTQNNFAMKNFEEKEEWERENYALSQLRHPHIIKQFEGRDNYILLEFCNNGELFDYVKEHGYFPEPIAKYYFKQLLDAIFYVHSHGFIHGDIKLENLLLDNDFNLKLADFGFAQKDQPRDDTFNLMGTEGYFAPEQLRREDHFGQPCDVFQMAVTLFSMIAGVPPYHREASDKDHFYKLIIQRKLTQYWSIIQKQTNREYSPALKDLLSSMLQNRPNMRITVEEMREHKWVTSNDVASPDEVREFMSQIRQQVQANKFNEQPDGQTEMTD